MANSMPPDVKSTLDGLASVLQDAAEREKKAKEEAGEWKSRYEALAAEMHRAKLEGCSEKSSGGSWDAPNALVDPEPAPIIHSRKGSLTVLCHEDDTNPEVCSYSYTGGPEDLDVGAAAAMTKAAAGVRVWGEVSNARGGGAGAAEAPPVTVPNGPAGRSPFRLVYHSRRMHMSSGTSSPLVGSPARSGVPAPPTGTNGRGGTGMTTLRGSSGLAGGAGAGAGTGTGAGEMVLQWLAPPRSALVVAKPCEDVRATLHEAVRFLTSAGLKVFVEPNMYRCLMGACSNLREAADDLAAESEAKGGGGGDPSPLAPTRSADWGSVHGPAAGGWALDVPPEQAMMVRTWEGERPPQAVVSGLDFVATLGGDGTVLWTHSILGSGPIPPVVSFALGSLGFMTSLPPERLSETLRDVLSGGFKISLRHRLHARVVRRGMPAAGAGARGGRGGSEAGGDGGWEGVGIGEGVVDERTVLNEVVIDRGMSPYLTNLDCYVDDTYITTVQGDGLIIATTSGSTAYSLAAGGSMVHTQVSGMLFTPICPHSLSFRPLVLPDTVTLRIQVPEQSRSEVWTSFDGKHRQQLSAGDAVVVHLSRWPIPAYCREDAISDWFRSISECLHWNVRKEQGKL